MKASPARTFSHCDQTRGSSHAFWSVLILGFVTLSSLTLSEQPTDPHRRPPSPPGTPPGPLLLPSLPSLCPIIHLSLSLSLSLSPSSPLPTMRVSRCTLFLLLLLCLPGMPGWTEAKRQGGEERQREPPPSLTPTTPQAARRPKSRSLPGPGQLSTKDGHRCTWETSGEGVVTLLLTCTSGGGVASAGAPGAEPETYWCRYAGKPDLCPAYAAKSSQYWKQLVGKLKKRRNACDGERVVKTKMCKKAQGEAHMKLSQYSGEEGAPAGEERRGRGGGRKKDATTATAAEDVREETERNKKDEEEEKRKKEEEERRRTGFVDERDGEVNDMVPMETYCAEGWHTFCSFFVRLFEG